MKAAYALAAVLLLSNCGEGGKKSGGSAGDHYVDLTDRSVCGPARASSAPLAGTSWSETFKVNDKVLLKRSITIMNDRVVLRQKATEILTGKTASLRAETPINGNSYQTRDLNEKSKTLALADGSSFDFAFDTRVGTITFNRTGGCLAIMNGQEINVLVPEL